MRTACQSIGKGLRYLKVKNAVYLGVKTVFRLGIALHKSRVLMCSVLFVLANPLPSTCVIKVLLI